ncbi:MAG: AAA family ATPase [Candidatus Omnitrophica bacterium]|nr:AAA family ATPase [Candidatus Omnitrophota bacterium]MDD5488299.1 AAA family ATPase [Candidatus Omnitrophota bacterium]
MRLTKIKIKNFRGIFKDQEVMLSDLTTIVGKNDSGKSIVLNAIASFLDNKSYPVCEKDFNINRKAEEPIQMVCTFSDEDMRAKMAEYLKDTRKKDIGIEEEVFSILQEGEHLVVRKTWEKPDKKPTRSEVCVVDYEEEAYQQLSDKADKDIDRIIKQLKISVPADVPGRNSKLEKIKYIKEYLDSNGHNKCVIWKEDPKIDGVLPQMEFFPSDHAISTDTKFNTSMKAETIEYFREEQHHEESKLLRIEKDVAERMQTEAREIEKYMKMHVSDLEKVEIEPQFNWVDAIKDVTVKLKFSKDKEALPMENKGAGYRRLFMVGRFRYLAEKKKSEDVIYAIEEPETFLHPSAQVDLLDSLSEISSNNQILVTTHSPVFAGTTKKTNIILCRHNIQSIYEQGVDLVEEIIEELGIKPSYNLRDSFEKIIFVEGKDDIDFLKIAAQKLKGIDFDDDEKRNKYLFLFGGGNTLANFIDIHYFSKSRRALVLLLDGNVFDESECSEDKQKSLVKLIKNNEALKTEFEKNKNAKCCILKKQCIENYYHPKAIRRAYGLSDQDIEQDIFPNNKDVINHLKKINKETKKNIKIKGNKDVYNEMSPDEWKEVSDGEIEAIIEHIVKEK